MRPKEIQTLGKNGRPMAGKDLKRVGGSIVQHLHEEKAKCRDWGRERWG